MKTYQKYTLLFSLPVVLLAGCQSMNQNHFLSKKGTALTQPEKPALSTHKNGDGLVQEEKPKLIYP